MSIRLRMLGWAGLALAAPALADSPLYETGPSQDSSFVRFVNASGGDIAIVAAKGGYRLTLGAAGEARVSGFHPGVAGRKLLASVEARSRPLAVEVVTQPGEYVTVVVFDGRDQPRVRLIRETPTDYNASRASIALANADPTCRGASLTGGGANAAIFDAVMPFEVKRRLVNPVKVSAQLECTGNPGAQAIDFGQLQPGERYSAFLIPVPGGRAAFVVRDAIL